MNHHETDDGIQLFSGPDYYSGRIEILPDGQVVVVPAPEVDIRRLREGHHGVTLSDKWLVTALALALSRESMAESRRLIEDNVKKREQVANHFKSHRKAETRAQSARTQAVLVMQGNPVSASSHSNFKAWIKARLNRQKCAKTRRAFCKAVSRSGEIVRAKIAERILTAIEDLTKLHGRPPTMIEVWRQLGFAPGENPKDAREWLHRLGFGWLQKSKGGRPKSA